MPDDCANECESEKVITGLYEDSYEMSWGIKIMKITGSMRYMLRYRFAIIALHVTHLGRLLPGGCIS